MVIEKIWTVYACPYCGKEYDDVSDAEECASECIDVDPPEEIDKFEYSCEICNDKFEHEEEAEKCESEHKKLNDISYENYKTKKEKERLLIIANKPGQLKLGKWGLK